MMVTAPNTSTSLSSVITASIRPRWFSWASSASASPGAYHKDGVSIHWTVDSRVETRPYLVPFKAECLDHLLHGWDHPVLCVLDMDTPFDGRAVRAIEHEDGGDGKREELGEAVENSTQLRVLTRLSMRVDKHLLALVDPDAGKKNEFRL